MARETWARWLGLNRATLAVLVAVFGLGLSEEIWKNFFGIDLARGTPDLLQAVKYVSVYAFLLNFAEEIAALYVVCVLGRSPQEYGGLAALSAAVALATYLPVGKLADRLADSRPLIGLTFLLFAAFPFVLN